MSHDREKRAAAEEAALLPRDGMRLGLGTGTTVAFFLPVLARRELDVVCVATSPETEKAASGLGLDVRPFSELDRLDLAVDGADQVSPDGWLVKGGGRALTREKIVAAAADRFVVIASKDKLVDRLRPPVPLELLAFGKGATLRHLRQASIRPGPASPDGGLIADWHGAVEPPDELVARLAAVPGVVEHGLFPPEMVDEVLVGESGGTVRRLVIGRGH